MLRVQVQFVVASTFGRTVRNSLGKMANLREFSSLKLDKALIGGQWVPAISKKTFEVTNPANGKVKVIFFEK